MPAWGRFDGSHLGLGPVRLYFWTASVEFKFSACQVTRMRINQWLCRDMNFQLQA